MSSPKKIDITDIPGEVRTYIQSARGLVNKDLCVVANPWKGTCYLEVVVHNSSNPEAYPFNYMQRKEAVDKYNSIAAPVNVTEQDIANKIKVGSTYFPISNSRESVDSVQKGVYMIKGKLYAKDLTRYNRVSCSLPGFVNINAINNKGKMEFHQCIRDMHEMYTEASHEPMSDAVTAKDIANRVKIGNGYYRKGAGRTKIRPANIYLIKGKAYAIDGAEYHIATCDLPGYVNVNVLNQDGRISFHQVWPRDHVFYQNGIS